MLGKLVSGVVGSSIAAQSGKSGALGAAAGLVVNRIVKRSPLTALVIGGVWVARKLHKRSQERQALEQANKPTAHAPMPVESSAPSVVPSGSTLP